MSKVQELAKFIEGYRFHSGLYHSEEISSEKCKEIAEQILEFLNKEV